MALNITIVAATPLETRRLAEALHFSEAENQDAMVAGAYGHRISLLHTGIGMVNTAWHLGRHLLAHTPDLAIQVGIAGSFPGGPDIGSVAEVVEDGFPELGAGSPEGFLDLKTMGFENFRSDSGLYYNEMVNPFGAQTRLPACRGITVNTVHGTQPEIDRVMARWNPQVESMEGAAFFQGCMMSGIRFLQLRGISNRVEPRNRSAWKIPEAAAAVQQFCLEYLQSLK
jgi:futalosine hydrolase